MFVEYIDETLKEILLYIYIYIYIYIYYSVILHHSICQYYQGNLGYMIMINYG